MGIKLDPAQIRLVFRIMVGAKTNGIPIIEEHQTWHNGIQVHDTEGLASTSIHENIIELGIIVGHAKR